jgi:membrane protease YdiL (CAAX protease family)
VENNSTWTPSQPSPTNWAPKQFPALQSLAFAFGAVFFAVAPGAAYVIYEVAAGRIDPHNPTAIPGIDLIYAQLLTYAVLLPYLLYFLPRVAHRSLAELGLRRPGLREIGIGLAGVAGMLLAVNGSAVTIAAMTHIHDTEAAVALLGQMKTPFEKTLFILVAAVLAPIIEELAFRAFLFNAFARYVPIALAAIFSALFFGLVHASSGQQVLTVAVPLCMGGLVLAAVYRVSRCYWSNVITHALFNSTSLIAVFVFHVKP